MPNPTPRPPTFTFSPELQACVEDYRKAKAAAMATRAANIKQAQFIQAIPTGLRTTAQFDALLEILNSQNRADARTNNFARTIAEVMNQLYELNTPRPPRFTARGI